MPTLSPACCCALASAALPWRQIRSRNWLRPRAHRTPQIDGVILRRGRVVPVCDIAEPLLGKKLTHRRFYLIATRRQLQGLDWVALPVSGECELIHADLTPAGPADSPHVAAWLSHEGEVIEVLNLYALTPGLDVPVTHPSSQSPEAHT